MQGSMLFVDSFKKHAARYNMLLEFCSIRLFVTTRHALCVVTRKFDTIISGDAGCGNLKDTVHVIDQI